MYLHCARIWDRQYLIMPVIPARLYTHMYKVFNETSPSFISYIVVHTITSLTMNLKRISMRVIYNNINNNLKRVIMRNINDSSFLGLFAC